MSPPQSEELQLLLTGAVVIAIGSWLLYAQFLSRMKYATCKQDQDPKKPKKFGVEKSNIADEFQHSINGAPPSEWRIKSLWIFPVKSCGGIELEESRVVATGLEFDRQFVLAEQRSAETPTPNWTCITQRQYPLMSQIRTSISLSYTSSTGGTLTLSFPTKSYIGKPSWKDFQVPLVANKDPTSPFPLVPVKVWQDSPLAYDMSSLVSEDLKALEKFLGANRRLGLFRTFPEGGLRKLGKNAPGVEVLGREAVTGFADSFPVHMLNLASIRDLNSRIADKIPKLSVRRFRANIIVSGPKAFDEDNWQIVTFNNHIYHTACRTTRCKLPNVDPDSGEKHPHEPDLTMRSYRRIDEGAKWSACMGLQLVPGEEESVLKVGDFVKVTRRGSHFYLK